LKILIPFPTTYRCESGFSTMETMKTKAKKHIKQDIRYAETETNC